MAASNVYLEGGPCDGRTVSANKIVGGLTAYIKCGGGYYVLDDGVTRPNGDVVFKYAGKTKPEPPSGGGVHDSHALHGWNDLRRVVNHDTRPALLYSQRTTAAALRRLGHARKVGR